jgi:acyl-CoA thioester hydrolase
MKQLEKFNQNYPIQIKIPVQWGDMDAFNHVNNAMYFKYFESVRIAYFEKLGVMGKDSQNNVAPILAETSCRFKYPLNFPDTILVGSSVIENHSHGFLMEYGIYSQHLKKICSIGTGRIVMLNYSTHAKVKVDDELINKIASIQNQ